MPDLPDAVVFLGNPGREYENTRHNAGFLVASTWLSVSQLAWKAQFQGLWTQVSVDGRKVPLLKPLTFMNLSGQSARALGDFLKIPADGWLAVHDDLEVPFGEIRVQRGGGLGGHNGLRSLRQHLGTDRFYRLRFGLGRPTRGEVADFVLSRFSPPEEIQLGLLLPLACQILEKALTEGIS